MATDTQWLNIEKQIIDATCELNVVFCDDTVNSISVDAITHTHTHIYDKCVFVYILTYFEVCVLLILTRFCGCALGGGGCASQSWPCHDDVIKWKHFPPYWPFVRGIHRSPVNSLHKGQWRGALMFSLICVWINGWENNRQTGDLRCYRTHCDVIVFVAPTTDCYRGYSVKLPQQIMKIAWISHVSGLKT